MDVTNDQLLEAYAKVPRPIREFLSNSNVGPIATSLAEKYRLHVDLSGALADVITKTLLGFIPPTELQRVLMQRLLLEQGMANSLIADINTLVFIPLQQKVREAAEEARREEELELELREAAAEEPLPVPPNKPDPVPAPSLDYLPRSEQVLPGSSVPVPAPVVHEPPPEPVLIQPQPTSTPMQQVIHAAPAAQAGWHPAAAVHIFVPSHPMQHPSIPQAPVAPVPETPRQVETPPAVPAYPATETPPPSTPITKSYAADPYREPV